MCQEGLEVNLSQGKTYLLGRGPSSELAGLAPGRFVTKLSNRFMGVLGRSVLFIYVDPEWWVSLVTG